MLESLMEQAIAFHGHSCPGLTIGVRVCEAVKTDARLRAVPYGKLLCVTENNACGVDAIQCLLGCSIGKGNLIYHGSGKQAFSFFDYESGYAVRLYLRGGNGRKMSREEWNDVLLGLPLDELFSFSFPKVQPPERPGQCSIIECAVCGEYTTEHKIRLQDGKLVCLDCFKPYGRDW